MKTFKTISMAVTLLALLSMAAFAQPAGLRADVPFSFYAGDTLLPAGSYTVRMDPASYNIQICSNDGPALTFVPARTDLQPQAHERTVLRFTNYGNTYFLKRVEIAGRSDARVLPGTGAEREMALTAKANQATVAGAQ